MKPFFSYFGAKWRLARWYPQPLPETLRGDLPLVEPFAGAAGYATYWGCPRVVLVEQDPRIAGVWDYLIRTGPQEILALPDLPPDGEVDDLKICQEAKRLVGFWLAAARAEPARRWSAWIREVWAGKRKSNNPLFWGPRVRARLAAQVPQIRGWTVQCCSWADADLPSRATWFIDPPYTVQGKSYKHHNVDYRGLGEWCQGLDGRVIACEGSGADWLPFEEFRVVLGSNGKNRKPQSTEYWWYKEDSDEGRRSVVGPDGLHDGDLGAGGDRLVHDGQGRRLPVG